MTVDDGSEVVAAGADATDRERPTLKTIAFMTGLGVTTVSRALKDAPDIGPDTRKRVQLVAKQVGYRPNRAGVRLRTGKTNVISLVLDTEERLGGFVSDIVYGVSEQISRSPYHLTITPYSRDHDPIEPVRYVVETGAADGIIISRTRPDDPRVRYLLERGFPFATHGRTHHNGPHPFHDFDNAAFASLAVESLTRSRRSRLALLEPPPGLSYRQHTRNGFLDGVARSGAQEVSFPPDIDTDTPLDVLKAATIATMQRPNRPDGIICSAGGSAFAIVSGIEEAGYRLGRDIDLVSKQSFRILRMFRPEIRVVNEDFRLAGSELARAVIGAIDGAPLTQLQSLVVPEKVEP